MNVKLKPCPFCGGEAEVASSLVVGYKCARCRRCGAGSYLGEWNARHGVRTPEQEAVIRAAVAWGRNWEQSQENAFVLQNAIDALLAAEPKWGG